MSDELVEREHELRVLRRALDQAQQSSGRAVLIEGAAGIGKSQLLHALRDEAKRRGVATVAARSSPLEHDFPFGVVRQLFESTLFGRDDLLTGAAATATAIFASTDEIDPSGGSFAALHGLFWLTLNVAHDQPLLIAIDDLQDADRASLRFVGYLARRLEDLPILLVATLRTNERGVDPMLLAELSSDPGTLHVTPKPLSPAGVDALVKATLGEDADRVFSDACAAATDGNPLLLRQLLMALDDEAVRPDADGVPAVDRIGPRAIARVVRARLARLPEGTLGVARALAVLGTGATWPQLGALAGVDESTVAASIAALASAEILDQRSHETFAHPLIREAIYQDLSVAERTGWHRRATDYLRQSGASPEQVAIQLLAAPPVGAGWAGHALRAAGHAAVARGAPDSAVAPLRRALDEPISPSDRIGVLVELGQVEAMIDGAAAIAHLQEAYELLDGVPQTRAHVALLLASTLAFAGLPDDALNTANRAVADTPEEFDDERRALEAIGTFAVLAGGAGDLDDRRRIELFTAYGASNGVGGDMLQLLVSWWQLVRNADYRRCVETARGALTDRLLAADDGSIMLVGVLTLGICDVPDALEVADRVRRSAQKKGSVIGELAISLWSTYIMTRRGELNEAETLGVETFEGLNRWAPGSLASLFSAIVLSRVRLEAGDIAGAREALHLNDDLSVSDEGARRWRRGHADVLLAEGRNQEAREVTEEARRVDGYMENPALETWREPMALALARLGRDDEAIAVAAEEVALAREFGSPTTIGRALRVLGEIGESGEVLVEAVEALEGTVARLELAKALGAYGAFLRHDGQPTEAREPLRRALDLADQCGAHGFATHIRTELAATGVRPRTTALGGVESLTPSERRVATLAARGMTNREIAQMLYVTPKTIEVHLSNTYRKLDIRSRRKLPDLEPENLPEAS